jgi:SAM-dependent methyltransferase
MDGVWQQPAEGIRLLRYGSYEAYRDHQVSKLATLDLGPYSIRFKAALASRLEFLSTLPRGATVLCLGARNGSECEVFAERGLFAVGIDLNPGPNNKRVLPGDFHEVQFADATADVIYTNALDHVFDFDKALGEIRRVLKPQGIFIAEIVRGSKDHDGREPGAYESAWWDHVDSVIGRIQRHGLALRQRTRFSCPYNGDQCVFAPG